MLKKTLIIALFIGLQLALPAQNKVIDSLEKLLKQHTNKDTAHVNLLNNIADKSSSVEIEKTLKYATEAGELADKLNFAKGKAESLRLTGIYYNLKLDYPKALDFLQKSLSLNQKIKDKREIAKCLYGIGYFYRGQSNYFKGLEYLQKSLLIYEEINDKVGVAKCLIIIGVTYRSQCNYTKALEYNQKSLKIYEEIHDNEGVARCLISIGIVNKDQRNYVNALEYYQIALKILEKINDKKEIAGCLNHIGNNYSDKVNYPKALEYYHKSLKISQDINDKKAVAVTLNNIGRTLTYENKFLQALEYLQKARSIFEEIGEKYFLSETYLNIGSLYLKLKNYNAALTNTLKGSALGKELNIMRNLSGAYLQLSEIFAATHNYRKAFESHKLHKQLNDSIFDRENYKKFTGLEYQYKYEKEKEAEKLVQEKKDALHKAEKKQQQIVVYSFITGFALLLLVIALVVRSNIHRRRTNIILTTQKGEIQQKNIELEQQKEEITTQNEEISETLEIVNQQNEEITAQRDLLHKQKKDIIDSINYAARIQNAVLPSPEELTKLLPEHFVLFKPRNIVSGDFYWLKKVKNYTFIAIADCTGHGVPGAFMSMLGVSFLNEAISTISMDSTGFILNNLRNRIKNALKQNDPNSTQKDGMDIVLLSIDNKTLKMQYSGAYNPLYVIRKTLSEVTPSENPRIDILQIENETLFEFKADRQPVSVHLKETDFQTLHFQLQPGDILYAGSDGYADQISGINQKKFLTKNLKKLLLEIYEKPLAEQSEILNSQLELWQGGHEQLDDILMMGVKV